MESAPHRGTHQISSGLIQPSALRWNKVTLKYRDFSGTAHTNALGLAGEKQRCFETLGACVGLARRHVVGLGELHLVPAPMIEDGDSSLELGIFCRFGRLSLL